MMIIICLIRWIVTPGKKFRQGNQNVSCCKMFNFGASKTWGWVGGRSPGTLAPPRSVPAWYQLLLRWPNQNYFKRNVKSIKPIIKPILYLLQRVLCQSGVLGVLGILGHSGILGALGRNGILGPLGQNGIHGPLGQNGILGPLGQSGILGPLGQSGILGPRGQNGILGPLGQNGILGPRGQNSQSGIPRGNVHLKKSASVIRNLLCMLVISISNLNSVHKKLDVHSIMRIFQEIFISDYLASE